MHFEKSCAKTIRFFQPSGRRASDADRAIAYLDDGLCEFMELQTGLKAAGRWEWAIAVINSVSALEPDVESFLQHTEKEEFTLYWSVGDDRSTPVLRLEYTEPKTANVAFITKHTRSIVAIWEERRAAGYSSRHYI